MQFLVLCVFRLLPANNNILSNRPNQLTSLYIDCMLPNNKRTQEVGHSSSCCPFASRFVLILLLLLLPQLLSVYTPGSKHISIKCGFFPSLFVFLVYAEECNHAELIDPFFFFAALCFVLCALCFVFNMQKLSTLHIRTHSCRTAHCALSLNFFSSRFSSLRKTKERSEERSKNLPIISSRLF